MWPLSMVNAQKLLALPEKKIILQNSFFKAVYYSDVCIHIFFIHLAADGHWGCHHGYGE